MVKYITFIFICFIFTTEFTAQPENNLILTEVMFNPGEPNSEFIEIYNPDNSVPINTRLLQVKYQTSSADFVLPAFSDSVIKPGSYAVIFEGDYDFENGVYASLIPEDALILKLDDNAFGSSGMANSSDRTIYLLNENGDTLSVYTYSADNPAGISDEKIEINKNNDRSNWSNSLSLFGTPGSKNSVSPVDIDVAVVNITFSPHFPIPGDSLILTASIANAGKSDIQTAEINFYDDTNLDSLIGTTERFQSVTTGTISPGDTLNVQVGIENLIPRMYRIFVETKTDGDENILNNIKSIEFEVTEPAADYNDVVINEIMYKPEENEPEWIEIFNKSDKNINILNWKINDRTTVTKITGEDFFLEPGEYVVISESETVRDLYNIDSRVIVLNLPSLNNSGDAISIKDSLGRIIDSVEYKSNWGGTKGHSLERIEVASNSNDSVNWSESINPLGATPGFINSVSPKDFDIEVSGIVFTPPDPFLHDTVSISAIVKNNGKFENTFYIKLFEDTDLDSVAEKELEKSPQLILNPNDSVQYDFALEIPDVKISKGFAVKIFAVNDQNPYNDSLYSVLRPGIRPSTVIINEIMFVPENGEPEWIELYNTSGQDIDLFNWRISDVLTTPIAKTINEHYVLPANGYLVISKSMSIYNYHRIIPSPVAEVNFANLNNDRDGVVVQDNRGITIDSVFYDFNLTGQKGYSIERISFESGSNNTDNWLTSADLEQSTPGRVNSNTSKKHDLAVAAIEIIPKFPVNGDDIKIKIKVLNRGSEKSGVFSVDIFTGENSAVNFLESIENDGLAPFDSTTVISSEFLKITDTVYAAARINFQDDEDELNNYAEKFFVTGYAPHSVLISEVMYKPENNEPEWIEFYNNSGTQINLNRWSIGNEYKKSSQSIISYSDVFIEPDGYFIVTKDTSAQLFDGIKNVFQVNIGKLNDKKDSIKIFDFRGAVIDSTSYNFSYQTKAGVSLERISYTVFDDRNNWSFCLSPKGNSVGGNNSLQNAIAYSKNEVVINEIMFDPENDNSEYVELLNISGKPVELGGWILTEGSGEIFPLSFGSSLIGNGEYYLIAADSSVFSGFPELTNSSNILITNSGSLGLSNSEDEIIIRDIFGNVIDSLKYHSSWHNSLIAETKNISLERINPSINSNDPMNWSSSAAIGGGTPLKQNSIYTGNVASASKLEISPNPFSPDNDGFEDFTVFAYNLTKAVALIRIRIFDSNGRKVRTLADNRPSGARGKIIFNGLDDAGKPLRIGIYIVLLEALDENTKTIEVVKKALVVARKL